MDTVMLDGVEYVKAAVAAKQFRYTADYIGQLCRGKKIDARLIGRTWFVNLESLEDHKRLRHQKEVISTPKEIGLDNQEKSSEIRVSRKHKVAPRVKTITLKRSKQGYTADQPLRSLRVAYEPDNGNLIPMLHKKQEKSPKTIRIEHVDAKRLSITGERATTLFQAGELPEVSLSGKLEIKSYPDVEGGSEKDETEAKDFASGNRDNFINKVISVDQKHDVSLDQTPKTAVTESEKQKITLQKSDKSSQVVQKIVQKNTFASRQLEGPVTTSGRKENDLFSPSPFTPRSVVKVSEKMVPRLVLVSPLIATLIAAVCAAFIMSASVGVVATDASYESHLILQFANMLELLRW